MRRRRRRREQPLRFEFVPPPPPPGKPTVARRRKIRWFRLTLVASLLLLLATVSAVFGFMTAVAQELPNLDQFTASSPPQVGFIYAADPKHPGRWVQIGVLRQGESRLVLQPSDISDDMKNAIVAIEDRRFYEHKGFDPAGIVRAAFKRILLGSNEGGSTITQQLIKNRYLTSEQSIRRKFQEIALAYQLERAWKSKGRILATYLNTIYFGHGCYGVASASEFYFGKPAAKLGIAESATLAAIPKSPTDFDPLRAPAATLIRRNIVIDAMVTQGFIPPAVGAEEKAKPLIPKGIEHKLSFGPTRLPYVVQYVTEQLIRRYGEEAVYNGGLKVYTTIDLNLQRLAEKTVQDHLRGVGPDGALVAIDPRSGAVKALVGGPKFDKTHQFDIATDGHRQPGSAFKPFVLIAALERGIQPATQFISRRVIIPLDQSHSMLVKNDTGTYAGALTLQEATTVSDNTVFAQLTQAVHPAHVVDTAHAMGINSPLDPQMAIGLGGLRVGVTPLEMAHAYATLAARGTRIGGSLLFHTPEAGYTSSTQDPISIEKVVFANGKVEVNSPEATKVVDETDALAALDTMRGVTSNAGTGFRAALPDRTVIGKTGTTSDFKDAWFVGMTPQLVTSVWVGYARPARAMKREYHGMEVFGGTIPAEIWHDFTFEALRGQSAEDWPHSPGRNQALYAIDIRKEPYELGTIGCTSVRNLVLATALAPTKHEKKCKDTLAIVPLLDGLTGRHASTVARGQGLVFESELVPAKPGQAIGKVVDQVPDAGVEVSYGDPVRVFIAIAVPFVRVPNVTTQGSHVVDVAAAVARLQAMRFKVVIADGGTAGNLPDGAVIDQDLEAGSPAPRGSVVTIAVVGIASGTVAVPPFVALTVADARAALAAVGLKLHAVRATGGVSSDADLLIDSDIGEGATVPRGTVIAVQTVRR